MACSNCRPANNDRTGAFDLYLGTDPDNGVPIIAEHITGTGPDRDAQLADALTKEPGAIREATGDEWERYAAYWNAKHDAEVEAAGS